MNKREEFILNLEEILRRADKDELKSYSIESLKMGWYKYSYYIVKKYIKKGYEYDENIDFARWVVVAMMGFNMKRAYKRAKYKDTKRYVLEVIGLNEKAYKYFKETFKPYKFSLPATYMYRYNLYKIFRGEIPEMDENVEIKGEIERFNLNLAKGMIKMMEGKIQESMEILYKNLQDTLDYGYDHTAMFVFRFLIPIVYRLQGKDAVKPLISLAMDVANNTGNRWFFEMFDIYKWFIDGAFTEYVKDKIRFFINRWALIHELLARGYLHKIGEDQSRRIIHIVKEHHHFHDLKVLELLGMEGVMRLENQR